MFIPEWFIWLCGIIGSIVTGALAILKLRIDRKAKTISNLSTIEAQNLNIWNQIDDCRTKLDEVVRNYEIEKEKSRKISEELEQVKIDLKLSNMIVERYIPLVETETRLKDLDTLKVVLDKIPVPLSVTNSNEGGIFTFINKAFAELLEMDQYEVKNFDWRNTIHPEDLEKASMVEAESLTKGGSGLRTRYRIKDKEIHLIWTWSSYRNGIAISIAEVLAVTNI